MRNLQNAKSVSAGMSLIEDIKKLAEKVTGWQRPDRRDLDGLKRARKPNTFRFKPDGLIPNHPRWPLVHYRSPVRLTDSSTVSRSQGSSVRRSITSIDRPSAAIRSAASRAQDTPTE